MLIRHATRTDIPALLPLLEMLFALEADFCFDAAKSRRGLEMMLDNPDTRAIVVAEIEGQLAGMCSAQMIVSTAMGTPAIWIEDVILKPEFRGRALMPMMLRELENWALERGVARFQLLCDDQNASALKFYPKVGFEPTQLHCFFKFPS